MACKISTTFCKASGEVLDYKVDWDDWLQSETISTSTWKASSGVTIDSNTNSTTDATVWLSGGTVGAVYTVVNTIATTAARTAARGFLIQLNVR